MPSAPRLVFCISGQVRDEHVCFPGIAELAQRLDATVIFSVWRRRGAKSGGIVNRDQAGRMFGEIVAGVLPPALLSDRNFDAALPAFESTMAERFGLIDAGAIQRYFPAAVIDIEDETLDLGFPGGGVSDKNSLRMLYKVWRCNEIKRRLEREAGRRFDLVVRMRPDVLPLLDQADVARMLADAPERTIHIPGAKPGNTTLDDVLAISSSGVADRYAGLFGKAILAPQRPWRLIHEEIAEHLAEAGIGVRHTALQHWIIEDFTRRQPANRALLLDLLAQRKFNEDFFPQPTTWTALTHLVRAADLAAAGAPQEAVFGEIRQIVRPGEGAGMLGRICRLLAIVCARAGLAPPRYAARMAALICHLHDAGPGSIASAEAQRDLADLRETGDAMGLAGPMGEASLRTALSQCDPFHLVWDLVIDLRQFVPNPALADLFNLIATATVVGIEAQVNECHRLIGAGDPQAALALGQAMVATWPNDWRAHDALGHAWANAGQLESALEAAECAYALEPGNGGLAARVGMVLAMMQRLEEGLPHMARATELWDHWHPFIWYADALRHAGRPDEAMAVLEEAELRWPGTPDVEALAALVVGR